MSEALTRVIAEQQAEIDRLNALHQRKNKDIEFYINGRDEMFSLVYEMMSTKGTEKYAEAWQNARVYMMTKGWCFGCGGFHCECHDD